MRLTVRCLAIGLAITLAPAVTPAQTSGNTDLQTAIANLSPAQLASVLADLDELSDATGLTLGQLATAANITLPAGIDGGTTTLPTTPPTLTAQQQQ